MNSNRQSGISAGQTAAALAIGSLALLVLGLQPILLGGLADAGRITMSGVGLVAMGEIVAVGIGVALSEAVLPVSQYKLVALLAAIGVAALDVLTVRVQGNGVLVALRGGAGVLEGALIWVATCTVVRTAKPDRIAAIFVVAQTVAQAAVAALLAGFVVPEMGWPGGFVALAVLLAIAALLSFALPSGFVPIAHTEGKKLKWSMSRRIVLVVVFLQMAALGALWAYLEPLGKEAGFGQNQVQSLVSILLLVQVSGGILATLLVRRLNVVFALCMGALILAVATGGIYVLPHGAHAGFAMLCAVFAFTWLFLNPFQFALAFRADGLGRVAVLMPAAQLLGLAFGPLAASFVVIGDKARPVALVSFFLALLSAVLVWAGRKYWEQADPMAHERYTGKTVLIAGASSGMGRALALRLAEEGAHLVVTARRKERLEELSREVAERGGHCLALAADAGDPDNAAAVVASAVEKFGRIDLAVLNIGGAPALDMRTMSARDVTAYMRSNYDTIVNYLFPVIDQMSAQRGGVIAHTNSLAGFLGVPLQGPYSAAKGALRLLFDTCRVEFGDRGIHFVSIYPGFIATEATANDGMPAPREISEDLAVEHLLTAIRQQRWDYAFPVSTSLLVKLAGLLPKPVTARILKSDYRTQHEQLLSMKAAGTLKAR